MAKEGRVKWFVLDKDFYNIAYNESDDRGESFPTQQKALAKAEEMAYENTGAEYLVCVTTHLVKSPLADPVVTEL
jgi:Uncharacterized protein conserved in bacteria (DUF2188)